MKIDVLIDCFPECFAQVHMTISLANHLQHHSPGLPVPECHRYQLVGCVCGSGHITFLGLENFVFAARYTLSRILLPANVMKHAPTRKPLDEEVRTLGKRIAYAREAKSLTQPQLAEIVLPQSRRPGTISKWENDHSAPDAGALALLAQTLEVSADWLLFGPTAESPAPHIEEKGVAAEPISDRERLDLLVMLAGFQAALAEGRMETTSSEQSASTRAAANVAARSGGADGGTSPEAPRVTGKDPDA